MIIRQAEKQKSFYKIFDFAKKINEERSSQAFAQEIIAAKTRLDNIRKSLDFAEDNDTKEYFIYRLKAAELDFSRYLKYAKNNNMTLSFFKENEL